MKALGLEGGKGCEKRHGRDEHTREETVEWVASISVCMYLLCSYMSSFLSIFSLDKKGRVTEGPWEKLGPGSGVTSAGTVQEGGT